MIKEVIFFDNGNTAVFNKVKKQLHTHQEPWIIVYAEWLLNHGIPEKDILKAKYWNMNGKNFKLFKKPGGGFGWEII